MISRRELEKAIAECENGAETYQNCEKLAVFYQLHDRLYGEKEEVAPVMRVQPYTSNSEFMQVIEGMDWNGLLEVLDELMDSLSILNPRLYNAVMRKLTE